MYSESSTIYIYRSELQNKSRMSQKSKDRSTPQDFPQRIGFKSTPFWLTQPLELSFHVKLTRLIFFSKHYYRFQTKPTLILPFPLRKLSCVYVCACVCVGCVCVRVRMRKIFSGVRRLTLRAHMLLFSTEL